MWGILGFVGATVFLVGLYQWAQGGATLWKIFQLKRDEKDKNFSRDERLKTEKEIQQLEKAADQTITASFKVIVGLAVVVWLFFGVTVVFDFFGIDWVSTLSSRAQSYWKQPGVESRVNTPPRNPNLPKRDDILRNMSSGVKK